MLLNSRPSLYLLLLLFVVPTAAQESAKKTIAFSGGAECGRKNFVPDADERIECRSLTTPRGMVSYLKHDNLGISVAFVENDDFIVAAVTVANDYSRPLDIDTDTWGAVHFNKPEKSGDRPKAIAAEYALPSRDIVRGIRSDAAIDNSSDTFLASMSKTGEVREVRRQDGTRMKKIVIVDDSDAQRSAGSRVDSRSTVANSEQERIRRAAFTQKWIAANSKAKGLVYFRRFKKAEIVAFTFTISDTNYIFRLLRKVS